MIKIIGAILIAAASCAWGLGGVMKLRGRARSLNAVASSLDLLKSEVCDKYTQMPELMELLAKETAFPVSLFYENVKKRLDRLGEESFSSIWRDAVSATPELQFTPQESLSFCELGYSVGKYNAGEQRGAIIYTQKRMEAFAKKAEAERDKDSKVQAFLGLASGLIVIIVLI